jgi:hypothetical protein
MKEVLMMYVSVVGEDIKNWLTIAKINEEISGRKGIKKRKININIEAIIDRR